MHIFAKVKNNFSPIRPAHAGRESISLDNGAGRS